MKFSLATTLTLSTLALATPAPHAGPLVPDTLPEFRNALLSRVALPELVDRATSSKPKGSKGGSSGNTTSSAVSISPSGALMMGALGVGVVEVLRLWN
ncbi:hypothetical protein SVAN01_02303 [Stagonosporopsis vannaccii]|nr:hypothetical protein SVAN01_02303 [Stagonosporopsis vannaccii]